ncbi:hypothetical protein CYMTET_55015 [Cymbomonas tetramitiformis]|uniref:Uncharacterized protein n=1 Tax=Cymbomonas tetramitiformis TaxID=36881 RepID=A0AAE0BFL7_9CHLO|nr:hypothetical protein CYMTET_55015 [Cymbomonas tetramitiformis]
MNQTDMTPARLKTSIAGFPSDDAAVTTPNTLREVFSQRKAKQGSRDDAAEKADTVANTVTFSETSSETHKDPEAAVCSALSDSEDVKPKSNACCYYLRKLLYIVTGTLLCAVIHDVARVVCQAAVPEKDIYVRSVDVRFPEQDPGSELRISGNISMSNYLLLTGFEGKSIDCEAFLFSRQRGASPEDDLTTLASMSWNNSQTSYDQQKPGGNHKITHLMSLSAHGNVQLEPLAVHRNINELELNIFNINVEEMQNLMMSDTRKSEHGQRIDSTLPPVEQVHLSCKAVIEIKLFGIVPHPLSVFLDETIQQKMFGGLNSAFVDMQVGKRKVTALRSFEETSLHWSSVKEKKQSDSSKAVPMSKILSAISITHSTIKGGKHGMLGLALEVAYDRLVNQSFWSEQWTSSEIRTTGMFARLSTAQVHLPRLSVASRAFNPLDEKAYQGPESVNVTAQSEEVTINVLSVLENETSISPQVNVALVCEYMNRAGDWHNCIRAGFWELRDDLRAVEDKLNLRKLLKAPWQHMNIWARGDDIVDDTRRLPPTSLTWSAVREQMDALYMQGKHPAERGLLDEEIPFLEELRPEEAFSMNMTCNNLLCDFGNNMASTSLSLGASENHVVCSLTVGTKLRANGTLVGGENDVGEWISYTKLETTWDSDTTAALQATARLSEDKQYGSMYILCDAEDWIGLEAFNGSGILNVDEDASYAEMSMSIIEIHKEESGENEEWLHVSSSVDVTSEGDAHSLSAHALVRVDGDEQMSMSTAAGYDDGGADMDMTVFDMVGDGTWHEDEGAAMVLTVEGDDEDEEWLHVSSSVDVTSEGDAHSLSAHALVRVDGDEQMSMSTAAGYDDGGADMNMTVAWDQEEYLRSVAHVRSTDVGDDATAVEMAALLRVDAKQVFDMVGDGTWHEDEGAAMVLTVEGDDEDEEWLHVSSSVDVTSEGDAHSLSAHALVRVDGDEQMSMSTAAGYDDGGADMNMTVAWDQEEYLRSVAHVRSTDVGDDATAVEMAALLRVDDKQVFDMVGNGTWHEDEGAAMVLTVEGDDEDEEWLHVSSSVDVTSEGDAHSLSAHALVRVDGDEQMSMSTAAGYDDGGADMNMTVAWDQEEYLRSVAHVRSTDAGDDATAVEMAALLRVDDKQVFDMVGNGTWREDEGAAMVLTVEGDDEDEEWLHVSSSVDVTSEGDAHSLSAHALVRVDGDEQMSMSTAAGYDDGGADMDMTVAWDQEEYLRSVAHVRSTDAGDDATAVEMAALLRVDDKQVFDMVGNGTWREDEGAAMVLTVEGDDEDEEWLHVSSSVDVTSEGDAHSLSAHALVRVDGDEQMSMSTAAGYDDGGADMNMTVAWDQEEYLRSAAHVRSTDAGDAATAVEMAALLCVDDKQVFDMVGNGTWREDEGAAMVLTVEGDDEDEEWLHVSSSVDVTSEGDAHSLSAHALVRVDGDEQMSMSTAAGYDDGGADMDMTVAWDQEEYLRSVAHVRSTDVGDDATAVEMAALLRVDDKQVFDMVGNGTWREDEGAAMVLTVEGDDEDEEWLHVSSSVDVTSEGDAHSLSAHALVRVDGDEQMSMSTAAGYDDGGADMNMTVAWDQEEYLNMFGVLYTHDNIRFYPICYEPHDRIATSAIDDVDDVGGLMKFRWGAEELLKLNFSVAVGDDWAESSLSLHADGEERLHGLGCAHATDFSEDGHWHSIKAEARYDDGAEHMSVSEALAIDFREDDFANLRTSLAIFADVYASLNETCTACTAAYARLLGAHAVSPPVASYTISIANMPYHHLSTIK